MNVLLHNMLKPNDKDNGHMLTAMPVNVFKPVPVD